MKHLCRKLLSAALLVAATAGMMGRSAEAASPSISGAATRARLAQIIDKTGLQKPVSSGNGFAGLSPLAPNTSGVCTASLSAAGNGRKLWVIYMVGADLESQGGFATANLNQLVSGWQQLAAKNEMDIVLAFGGAKKDGWRGVKYASMAQIVADGADGVYGNGSDYLFVDTTADMGQQATFEAFLNFVNGRYGADSRKLLSFWDHGSAYNVIPGIGPDQNTGSILDLGKINNALANTGSCYHLIGFDACLMASMESAVAIKDFALYMVASEELEPGHGWNYADVLNALASQPDNPAVGKAMVDSFVDSSRHAQVTSGKTLSVLDLGKMDGLLRSLDPTAQAIAAALNGAIAPADAQAVIRAFSNAQQYSGKLTVDPSVIPSQLSIDLKDFLSIVAVRSQNPDLRQKIATTTAAIDGLVVYSRDDGSRPGSTGVSIAPLDMYPTDAMTQVSMGLLNNGWGQIIITYHALSRVATAPKVSGIQRGVAGASLSFVSARDGSPDSDTTSSMASELGMVASITSPYLADVRGAFGVIDSDGGLIQLGESPAYPTTDGRYFFPQWNGQGMALISSKETVYLPVLMTEVANAGTYFNTVVVIERPGVATPILGLMTLSPGQNGAIRSSITVILQEREFFFLSRRGEKIKDGDTVSLFAMKLLPNGESSVVLWDRHTFGAAPSVGLVPLTRASYGYTLSGYSIGDATNIAPVEPVDAADRLFNWGAALYPDFRLDSDSLMLGGYYARCNDAKSVCVGVKDGQLWFLREGVLNNLGSVNAWLPQAQNAGY